MRKTWITTFAAGMSAVGMIGASAQASPAGMARPTPGGAKAAPAASVPVAAPVVPVAVPVVPAEPLAAAPIPSAPPAQAWHPFKFLGTTATSKNPVMPPAQPQTEAVAAPTPQAAPAPQQLIATAQECERLGDIHQARQHYYQGLTMWPGHVEVLRAAARMEDRLGEMPVAESLYGQAVAANPQHAGALNDLGLCLARQGRLEASVQAIEQAIHLQPDKPLYRNNAATVLVELRQDQKALAHLAAVHAPAEANYNFGQLLVQRGRAADATPYFHAAVEQNPELQPARIALAKLQGREVADVATAPAPATSGSRAAWPPTAAPQSVVPVSTPPATPQYAPQAGPQLYYPSAAWSPESGASGQAPPAYYPPAAPYAATNPPTPTNAGPAPRYLPPVASQPGPTRR